MKIVETKSVNKIAEITVLFWVMKIVATTLGETLGDFISMTLNLGYLTGIAITVVFFIVLLYNQLKTREYKPLPFWLVIIATTTLGTEISDFIDRSLHLGYTIGTLVLLSGLLFTLYLWYSKYKNLNVNPITENKKEIYFWIAVLFSNSLGTAFGDYLGDVIGLSYIQGALITASIIIMVVLIHYYTKINEVFLFWLAFVFTRPFGATFGDFLTKPLAKGGLDLGTLQASIVSIIIMLFLIYYSHKKLIQIKIKMKHIPKINFIYWVLMIIATTTGEIVGNYISRDLGLGYKIGSILLVSTFVSAILYSILTKKFNQLFYWLLIILGNIGGTNIADLICIDLNLGTIYGSLLVISMFLLILLAIKIISRKPSVISEMKIEFLYWFAILTSSTFGTTSGDYLSNDTPLGADGGTILLIALLIFSILLLRLKQISKNLFYWLAIIIIHPIGATFGNYISKPAGLNFGNVYTSIFLIIIFSIMYNINQKN